MNEVAIAFPILVALIVYLFMSTWKKGRARLSEIVLENTGTDVVLLNLKGVTDMTDFFIIASGTVIMIRNGCTNDSNWLAITMYTRKTASAIVMSAAMLENAAAQAALASGK